MRFGTVWLTEHHFIDYGLSVDPATLVAAIAARTRRARIGQILCWMSFGGLAQDKVRRSMELFTREVMPRFR